MLAWALTLSAGEVIAQSPSTNAWPRLDLSAEQVVPLNLPEGKPFDASGLLLTPRGDLLTVNDKRPGLFRIVLRADGASADLIRVTNYFTDVQLAPVRKAMGSGRFDLEGIAQDEQGRIYLCEEAQRVVLRCAAGAAQAERIPVDWTPVKGFFSPSDPNASFEGIAVGDGRMFLANERHSPRLIVVDLKSLKVVDHFVVYPQTPNWLGTHYSDLCWFEGRLFVLLRQHQVVLEVNPDAHTVLAEYDYRAIEDALDYRKELPAGIMEGLAVSKEHLWLLTDNNGWPRANDRNDRRPTLVKCRRPSLAAASKPRE